jgi:hypothetical protein
VTCKHGRGTEGDALDALQFQRAAGAPHDPAGPLGNLKAVDRGPLLIENHSEIPGPIAESVGPVAHGAKGRAGVNAGMKKTTPAGMGGGLKACDGHNPNLKTAVIHGGRSVLKIGIISVRRRV